MKIRTALVNILLPCLVLGSCKSAEINSWYYDKINAAILQDKEKKQDIIVGVIDSGFSRDFLRFFDDGTIVDGFDFVDNDSEPYSAYNLHGSYISYLIAGKEAQGLTGIDPRLKVMPVRVFDESGNTTDALVRQGIEYAISNGCSIINMCFSSSKYDAGLESLFRDNGNVRFVASVGDFSSDSPSYPADYEGLVPVSPVDEDGKLYQYSDKKTSDESVFAPGVDLPVVSVNVNSETIRTSISGSSYAAAIVSGIISSLLLSDSLNEEALASFDVYTDGFLDCRKLLRKSQS
jgi:subtilisin family serine protease